MWLETVSAVNEFEGLIILGRSPNMVQEKRCPFFKAEEIAIPRALARLNSHLPGRTFHPLRQSGHHMPIRRESGSPDRQPHTPGRLGTFVCNQPSSLHIEGKV